jgi:DNA-binding LacI/PurR family transcriptional regulator
MADVARLAGVSHQTVSRVLNGHPTVRGSTRARVLDAVQTLGYRPNLAARALVSRHSGIVGVLAMETTLFGPASILYAIERAARAAGYFVSVATIETLTGDAVTDVLERFALQAVEGVVAIAPLTGAMEALSRFPTELPVVVVEGSEGAGRSVVSVDQVSGAAMITQHLLDEGAPTVWHIAGPDDWFEARARILGWRQALEGKGIAAHEPLRGDWSAASGYTLGQQLAERADVRAVFVANDQMALGALRAFHERGVRVPEDVLVAGFDDMPEAAYFTPPLTTIRQDFFAVGQQAIDLLVAEIKGAPSAPTAILVPATLVTRQSTVGHLRIVRKETE